MKSQILKSQIWKLSAAGWLLAVGSLAGCGNNAGTEGGTEGGNSTGSTTKTTDAGGTDAGGTDAKLTGQITGDGSSTVFPITEAVAEEFGKTHPDVKVTVGVSGTGGGFKKFIAGDTILQDASRPIKDEEAAKMKAAGRDFIEIPVAYDGLSVVVNPKNTWANDLTKEELKKIWNKGSKINNWSQVRAGFPNKPLKLYGPGTDSGTFEYFNEAINDDKKASRADYTASEDDNTLVQGVSKEEGGMAYFGFGYYEANQNKLKLLAVNGVKPDPETIKTNKYKPLSRPLFIYIERKAADRPEVQEFVKFYLSNAKDLVKSAGYVPLPDSVYQAAMKRFEGRTVGTIFGAKAKGKTLAQLYSAA